MSGKGCEVEVADGGELGWRAHPVNRWQTSTSTETEAILWSG